MEQHYDGTVVGGGAAGLIGALELALTGKSVAVLEAKDRCGGRINTHYLANGYPVELGAEFVHGNLPITQELAQKAGLRMYEVVGSIWQKKDGELKEQQDFIEDFGQLKSKFNQLEYDLPVDDFINVYLQGEQFHELRFTLRNYVEGYYAADIKNASTFALREELTKAEDEQFRLETGYQKLVDYLESECKKRSVQFHFSSAVRQLNWQSGKVEAITESGSFIAKKALITVSMGVLQAEGITFSPSLSHISEAAKNLGFGHVKKINLWFEEAFWKNKFYTNNKDLHDLNFLFSEETIPTWWTQHPRKEALISGWLGGPKAKQLQSSTEEEIIAKAIHSLSNIFGIDVIRLRQLLKEAKVYNWSADTHFKGAYSYEVVNGPYYMQKILQPVDNTIYFAGEGLHHGNEIGTVEAALQSGRSVSQRLIAEFS
ncbi:MAG: FAD-dependent oxidoreductase [Chitinophagaceae bacterium]|nr:MAG: FAD-dependent oxidoreductase [Chitinophagaceae bacterium]